MHIVGFSGGLSALSRTLALVESILKGFDSAPQENSALANARKTLIDFAPVANQFGAALSREQLSSEALALLELVENADILVVASPIYNAAYPGLFKHFFDLIKRKGLEHKTVIIAANGASAHHALVVESHLRPLFSSLGAFVVPTGIYSEASDFTHYVLTRDTTIARINDAIREVHKLYQIASASVQLEAV
jgi:FMN reductase